MRRAALQGVIVFYALAAIATECLHALHALSRGPVAAAWCVMLAAAAAVVWRGRRRMEWPRDRVERLCLAGVLSVVLPVGFLAAVSRPTVLDALAYHMPRVIFWAQARSLDPFPTNFPQQIALQPFNEYLTLHVYLLSGGSDRWVNLVQFAAFAGCIAAVSLIAGQLGASRRGQSLAALFCATIPTALLQGSGAKNDLTAAFTLAAAAYFTLSYLESRSVADLIAASAAFGLSLLTKGTAYIFGPPLLAAIVLARPWREQLRLGRAIPVAAASILLLNGPFYWREMQVTGSPLGMRSVYSNGEHRFGNDRLDAGVVVSNVIRNAALQFNMLPKVVSGVYRVHNWLGLDANDPATTWTGTEFRTMESWCTAKETCAPSPVQSLILAGVAPALWWGLRRKHRAAAWYAAGVAGMFLLFCIALRWQPWHARMHGTILILGAPMVGIVAERLRWRAIAPSAVGLTLLAQPYIYRNFDRPLIGRASVLLTDRPSQYFSDLRLEEADYRAAVEHLLATRCTDVGIENSYDATSPPPRRPPPEYAVMALLRMARPESRFIHAGVRDPSERFRANQAFSRPCAVICLECKGDAAKIAQFAAFGGPRLFGKVAVFHAE